MTMPTLDSRGIHPFSSKNGPRADVTIMLLLLPILIPLVAVVIVTSPVWKPIQWLVKIKK